LVSLSQQIEALRAYAAGEGDEVLEEAKDPGQSEASLEHPGMDRGRDPVGDTSLLISFSIAGEYTSITFSARRGSILPASMAILMVGYPETSQGILAPRL
jgi:hypothetical protein